MTKVANATRLSLVVFRHMHNDRGPYRQDGYMDGYGWNWPRSIMSAIGLPHICEQITNLVFVPTIQNERPPR